MTFLILYTLILFLIAFFLGAAIGGAIRSFRAFLFSDWRGLSLQGAGAGVSGAPMAVADLAETPVVVEETQVEPVHIVSDEVETEPQEEWAEVSRAADESGVEEDVAGDEDAAQPLETSDLPAKEELSAAEVNLASADEVMSAAEHDETALAEEAVAVVETVDHVEDNTGEAIEPLEEDTPEEIETPVVEVEETAEVEHDEIGYGVAGEEAAERSDAEEVAALEETAELNHDEMGYGVAGDEDQTTEIEDVVFSSEGPAQDLTQIKGIDQPLAEQLAEVGINRFEQIAYLTTREIDYLRSTLNLTIEPNQQSWIEQAKILADGGVTAFLGADETTDVAEPAEVEEAVTVDADEVVLEGAAEAVETIEEEIITDQEDATALDGEEAQDLDEVQPLDIEDAVETSDQVDEIVVEETSAVEVPVDSDDLKQIKYISTGLEKKLNLLGVYKLSQIANWSDDDISRISEQLEIRDQIREENWMVEAQKALDEAEANLDEADVGDAGAELTPLEPAPVGEGDDLRRIRGIDGDAERVLHELNVTTYAQISDWDHAKMEQVNDALGTAGRVQRQYWVVQAKVLRDGGVTEFSRLYDEN